MVRSLATPWASNTAMGFAGTNITSANNVICIGSDVAGTNVDGTTYIAGIFGATTQLAATPVLIDSNGQSRDPEFLTPA